MRKRLNDAALKILQDNVGCIQRVFSGPDGAEALKVLERAFDGDTLRGETPEDTYYNLGARDVVVYIRQLNNYEVKDVSEIP